MGFFDRFKKAAPAKPEAIDCVCPPMTVLAPVAGTAIALSDAPDPVFSEGILGQGLAIKPSEGVVYAPVDGEVSAAADTGHACGLVSTDGVEVLIHVGVDTVTMGGDGFTVYVKQGDVAKAGTPLLSFDSAKIRAAGHPDEVMVIVSNTAEFAAVEPVAPGAVQAGQPVISIR